MWHRELELTRDREGGDPFTVPAGPVRYLLHQEDAPPEPTGTLEWGPALRQRLAGPEAGRLLADLLAPTRWPTLARELLEASRSGERALLTLRFNAAELFALPWESLSTPDGRSLSGVEGLLLRYTWPGPGPAPLRGHARGCVDPALAEGRLLFAWSEAGGAVPHEAQREALAAACLAAGRGFAELERCTLATLVEALRREPPASALHLLAHGQAQGGAWRLMLGRAAQPQALDASTLAEALGPHADALRLVVLAACGGAQATGQADVGSHARALHRAGIQAVLGARAPLSTVGSTTFTQVLFQGLLTELGSLEGALSAARGCLARERPEGSDRHVLRLFGGDPSGDTRPFLTRPYRGLQVFEREHQRLLFGRDAEIDETLEKLAALRAGVGPRLLFVAGASGSGKSSLVRAGVLPRLDLPAHVTRPSVGLGPFAPLTLVDQAEEAFTQLDAPARAALFAESYERACDDRGGVVILTMRVDYLGRLGELVLPDGRRLDSLAYDDEHRVFVPMLDRQAMLQAITGPAALAGLPVQEGLAEQLVDEVAGEPGALPLLEFALDRAWLERRPGEGLTLAGYRRLGGAVGALLEREADALIHELSEAERTQARRLLVQLVATGEGQRSDTRRSRTLSTIRPEEDAPTRVAFDAVLSRLTAARLVVTRGEREPQVEIAHEELIRRWGTLRDWVDADRQKWIEIERVRAWTHLLRGAQLDRAREARERYGDELGPVTLAHIAESERVLAEEAARERRRQEELQEAKEAAEVEAARARAEAVRARRRAWGAAALFLLALGAAVVAAVFYGDAQESLQLATDKTAEAEAEARRAQNALRVGAAQRLMDDDPSLAALFLLEVALKEGEELPGLAEVAARLSSATAASWVRSVPWEQESPEQQMWPSVTELLLVSMTGQAQLWNLPTLAPRGPAMELGVEPWFVGSPWGHLALTRRALEGGDTSLQVWSLTDGAPVGPTIELQGAWLRTAEFAAAGRRLAVIRDVAGRQAPDELVLLDLESAAQVGDAVPLGQRGSRLSVSPRGDRVVAVSDGRFIVADAMTAQVLAGPSSPPGPAGPFYVDDAAFSEDGRLLVLFSREGLALWDVEGDRPLGEPLGLSVKPTLEGQRTRIDRRELAVIHDDALSLVSLGPDGPAVRWLWSVDEDIQQVSFSEDGGSVLLSVGREAWRLDRATGAVSAGPWGQQAEGAPQFDASGEAVVLLLAEAAPEDPWGVAEPDAFEVWSAGGGQGPLARGRHASRLMAVRRLPGGAVVDLTGDGRLHLWEGGEPLGDPFAESLAASEPRLVGGVIEAHDAEGRLRRWSTRTGLADGPPGEVAWGEDRALDRSGRWALELDYGEQVRLLGPDDSGREQILPHPGVRDARFIGAEGRVMTSGGGQLRLWSLPEGAPVGAPIPYLAAEGTEGDSAGPVLLLRRDGALLRVSVSDGSLEVLMRDVDTEGARFGASPGGAWVWACDGRGACRVQRGSAGAALEIEVGEGIEGARATPGGQAFVIRDGERDEVSVWSAETGQAICRGLPHVASVWDVVVSEDGEWIVLTESPGTLRAWSLSRCEAVGAPMVHRAVDGAVLSPDGGRLITTAQDGSVSLWDSQTGALLRPLRLPPGGLSYSDDGGHVVASTADVLVHVGVLLDADGERIYLAPEDDRIQIFDAQTGASLMDPLYVRYLRERVRGCVPISYRVDYLGEPAELAAENHAACEARLIAPSATPPAPEPR